MKNINKNITAFLFKWNAVYLIIKSILIFLLCLSCSKELDLKLDGTKSFVLNSLFRPDSAFSFRFSHTASPLENYNPIIENIHLILKENNIILIDTIFQKESISLNIFPNSNSKYSVEVLSDNMPSIFSSDSIPNLVDIDEAFIFFPAGVDQYGDYLAEAIISFVDPDEETNYYELLIFSGQTNRSYWHDMYQTSDRILLDEGDMDYHPTSFFFSDKLFNGKRYTMRIKHTIGYSTNNNVFIPDKHYVILRSVSKAYYLYRKFYTRHSYNQQMQGDFLDIIFKGEPQNMYSNITNGHGIFAGYQETMSELYYQE